MLGRVVDFFVGGVASNEHMHVNVGIVMKSHVALNTIWVAVIVQTVAYPAFPFANLFLPVLFLLL